MANTAELLAAISRFVDLTEPTAFAIVTGDENTTVTVDGVEVPTFRKLIADLSVDAAYSISTQNPQSLTDAAIELFWTNARVMPFATLAEANAEIGVHNVQFYNTTLKCVQMTT